MADMKSMADFERRKLEIVRSALDTISKEFLEWYGESQSSTEFVERLAAQVHDNLAVVGSQETIDNKRDAYIEQAVQDEFECSIRRDGKFITRAHQIRKVLTRFRTCEHITDVSESTRRFARALLKGGLLRSASIIAGMSHNDKDLNNVQARLYLYGKADRILCEYDLPKSLEECFPFTL